MGAAVLRLFPLFLLLLACARPAAGQQLCLECHPLHYADKGSCSSCHRGNPASARKNIAHARLIAGKYASFTLGDTAVVRSGRQLLDRHACRRCHVIAGRGNRLATDLDQAAARKAPPELATALQQPAEGMPDFRLDEPAQTAIINALQAAAQQHRPRSISQPQKVHFSSTVATGQDLFSRKCGPCHRILSQRHGALGRGNPGPNLSGLLTPFYPPNFRNDRPWTEAGLARWLQNPRRTRPWALMQPVALSKAEFTELTAIMLLSAGTF